MVQQLQAELQDKAQHLQTVEWEKCRELQAQGQRVQRLSQHLARKEQLLQVRCRKIQFEHNKPGPLLLLWYPVMQKSACSFHARPSKKGRKAMLLGSQDEEEGTGIRVPQPTAMPGEPWQV